MNLRGYRLAFPNQDTLKFLKNVLVLANSTDAEEMQHNAAFHLGMHCFPKYLFRGFRQAGGRADRQAGRREGGRTGRQVGRLMFGR